MLFRTLRAILRAVVLRFLKVEADGLEHLKESGPLLLAGNHPTIVDGLLLALLAPRKVRFVAAPELLEMVGLRHLLRWLGAIPAGPDAVQHAVDALEAGDVVLIFPEGKTSQGERILPFRTGAERIAGQSGVPITPFALDGTQHVYPEGAWIARPARVTVTIGSPVNDHLQQAVEALWSPRPVQRHRTVTSALVVPFSLTITLLHKTKAARKLVKRLR